MITINIKKYSKSKSKRQITRQHLIYGEHLPQSYAGYIQMKRYFRDLELKDLGYLESLDWFQKLSSNTKFLEKKKEECGSLSCVFCGKPDLVIFPHDAKNKDRKIMATADHFIPNALKLVDYYEHWNLVVSCYRCNNKKKALVYPLTTIKYINPTEYKELFKKFDKIIKLI